MKEIARQISKGLEELKRHQITHRDLKLANILLHFPQQASGKAVSKEFRRQWAPDQEPVQIVIADLGFAKRLKEERLNQTQLGTPLYMAPELLTMQPYGYPADIWAFGTIVYSLLVGDQPFKSETRNGIASKLVKGDYKIPEEISLSPGCLDFLAGLLRFDPDTRLRHEELT